MKIGMIGLGKLGLPVAVAMDLKGHEVTGYDINPALMQKKTWPYLEAGPDGTGEFLPYLQKSGVRFGALADVVKHAEIIFVAVQTPHDPRYEGITRLPAERVDFDYRYLEAACKDVFGEIARQGKAKVVAIISTVLPGTIRERILPLANDCVTVVYNPAFIAMGTVLRDFLEPEFVLIGARPEEYKFSNKVATFYTDLLVKPLIVHNTIETAEIIKVSYNTYIGMKIAFANTVMEICHKTPCANSDDVINALEQADRRLMSAAYLYGGMGDGGGCHPRDNIAMSYLARKLNLSYDLFDSIMTARERQTDWLAKMANHYALERNIPIVILGTAFKPETNIETGSPALLLKHVLADLGHYPFTFDPFVSPDMEFYTTSPAVFVIATMHAQFADYEYPRGSVVIDPHRYIEDKPGVDVIQVGIGQ